jgi:hypothetical protein
MDVCSLSIVAKKSIRFCCFSAPDTGAMDC